MIRVSGLSKNYGEKRVLDNVSFTLEDGEVTGLLGLNGAGKTTTIRILTGFLVPGAGSVEIDGVNLFENPLEAKKKTGYLPETPPLYEEMTVGEYLEFVCRLKDVRSPAEEIARVMEKTGITAVQHQVIGSLSLGYRKRTGIAQALVGDPALIVMDEPVSGLDPRQIVEMRELIAGLSGTVLVSSHILSEVYKTCDRFLLLRDGKIAARFTHKELEDEMKKNRRLEIRIAGGSADEIRKVLEGMPLAETVVFAGDFAEGALFHVTAASIDGFRRELFPVLAGRGLELVEIHSLDLTLEDIFIDRA